MLLDTVATAFLFNTRNVLVLSSYYITYHWYADDTQPNLSFPCGSAQCEAFICGCHVDISVWMPAHHFKLSLDKSELLSFQGCFCPLWDLSIITNNTTVTPAACQQFQCNSWQPAVIHQTFATTTITQTYIFLLHICQFRHSLGTHPIALCLD